MVRSSRAHWRAGACLLLAAIAIAPVPRAAATSGPAGAVRDLFDDLYQRGQKQNGDLRTFTASFSETTTSTLLTRPLLARGSVAVERPSRVALRYSEPDERVVIIDGNTLTIAWPSRGVRQTRDIGAAQKRVQKYFVDSSPSELRSHFDIAARERPDRGGYAVTLVPKRKQIREGLTRLELQINPETLLLDGMEMTFPNGDTKRMTFSGVTPNAPLDAAMFSIPEAARPVQKK
jgi:outer membrane lipoprotein-sorting protein